MHLTTPTRQQVLDEKRKFACDDCGTPPDCPQLIDEVWYLVSDATGLLCIKHAEERLGRHIQPADLVDCPANAYALTLAERQKHQCN